MNGIEAFVLIFNSSVMNPLLYLLAGNVKMLCNIILCYVMRSYIVLDLMKQFTFHTGGTDRIFIIGRQMAAAYFAVSAVFRKIVFIHNHYHAFRSVCEKVSV